MCGGGGRGAGGQILKLLKVVKATKFSITVTLKKEFC